MTRLEVREIERIREQLARGAVNITAADAALLLSVIDGFLRDRLDGPSFEVEYMGPGARDSQ